ncbi:hypothetical protein N7486_006223 [Penicillium sp. IBT 16267x]|nr:hypothetical protein N7486_006223 [Penicillium sp. IBT 16267x]
MVKFSKSIPHIYFDLRRGPKTQEPTTTLHDLDFFPLLHTKYEDISNAPISFIIGTACVALLTETLLYGFLVPILPYMLENRLNIDPAQTQRLTAGLLSMHGLISLVSAPIIASLVDRTESTQNSLLISLGVCLVGRALQAIAGSGAWIVCLAILVENSDDENIGKTMGLSMSFIMSGAVGGPIIAGALLEWVGYWLAWTVPLGLLLVDSIARLFICQPHRSVSPSLTSLKNTGSSIYARETETTETSPLLTPTTETPKIHARGFYNTMLRDIRTWGSLLNTVVYSAIIAGFNTTLPVHLGEIFKWGSLQIGIVFFILQIPLIILSPLSGLLRDRVGLRFPTTLGWTLLVPLLLGLGIPGSSLSRAIGITNEQAIFISCMAGIGFVLPLLQGAGALNSLAVSQLIESKNPNIFGIHGGRSRIFAMNSVTFNLGLMLGPLVSGALSSAKGYLFMNVTQGER